MAHTEIPGYRLENNESQFLGKTPRTLKRWRQRRVGPPVTIIGRTVYYSILGTDDWLLRQERQIELPKRRRAA